MNLLGRQKWESFLKIEPHLVAEHTEGARSGAVAFLYAFRQDAFNEIVVLLHVTKMVEMSRNCYGKGYRFSTEK